MEEKKETLCWRSWTCGELIMHIDGEGKLCLINTRTGIFFSLGYQGHIALRKMMASLGKAERRIKRSKNAT